MFKWLANAVILMIALMALAGCGGSGGDDSGYTGKTSAAALSQSNAGEMSTAVLDGVATISTLGGIAKATADSGGAYNAMPLRSLSDILVGSVVRSLSKPVSAKTVADAVSSTENGYYGSFSYSGTFDSATGAFAVTITFDNYQETADSLVIQGAVSVSGTVQNSTRNANFYRLTFVIDDLWVGGLYYHDSGPFLHARGKIMTEDINGGEKTTSASLVFTEVATRKSYWYKDFVMASSPVMSPDGFRGFRSTMNGTFYHPVHGRVAVTTPEPLSVNVYGDPMYILLTGDNGSKIRLTYVDTEYTVEVDADGMGNYVSLP